MKPESQHKIQAALDHAMAPEQSAQDRSSPCAAHPLDRNMRRYSSVRRMVAFYKTYTKVGFFPYFRRGVTRGMVEDLIDPQREKNKKRSVINDILSRNANSGWIYEENSLDPDQEENLKKYGSSPGIHVKWKSGPGGKRPMPQRIEPGGYPQGLDRLEEKFSDDMYTISGVNESALGQL